MAEKNALAELADRLDVRKSTDFILHVDASDVALARRIVAELAKVEELRMALAKEKVATHKWFGRFARLCNAENRFFKMSRAIAEKEAQYEGHSANRA